MLSGRHSTYVAYVVLQNDHENKRERARAQHGKCKELEYGNSNKC